MEKPSFEVIGRVEAVLIGETGAKVSGPVSTIACICRRGVEGDRHAGVSRRLGPREPELLKRGVPTGVEIANIRQVTIISIEELAEIARDMGTPTPIPFGLLSENVVVSGIHDFTHLPIGTLLFFRNTEGFQTTVLLASGENDPCYAPGRAIQQHFSEHPGLGLKFTAAALGKRGVTAIVYASGTIAAGDEVIAVVPAQRIYGPR